MNIKTEIRMLRYLEKRIKAQEGLLAAYRIGGRPNSVVLDTLSGTQDWEKVLENYKEK